LSGQDGATSVSWRSDSLGYVELGLATFADVPLGAGAPQTARRLKELLQEIELADRLGLEVFGLGEHHRPDYAVSAPPIALAAAAARTERIRLSSAVTVLSSADPVRVFEDFATLDLISGGRAEIMAGRGSFTESFSLFGYDLDDYDELFAEKLELLLALRDSERVTWSGRLRPALRDAAVYPRPLQRPLPVWIAVGGTPVMNRIGRERGWPPMGRAQFDAACGPEGHLLVGSVQQVVEKILAEHELFGHDRFLAHVSIGTLPHARAMRAIELFGSEVAPAVRAALAPVAAR
jgi:alkanesulfonate monooxygenase SsuD/methylene tetrahydromethanopterin reductase-like flavin-dependent oxidoreductase (luciferase family)